MIAITELKNLPAKAGERQLADEKLPGLLVSPHLSEGNSCSLLVDDCDKKL
jgi:hypothetical protein